VLGQDEGTTVTAVETTAAEREGEVAGRAGRDRKEEIDWVDDAAALRPDGRPRFRREPPEGVWRGGGAAVGVEEDAGGGTGFDWAGWGALISKRRGRVS